MDFAWRFCVTILVFTGLCSEVVNTTRQVIFTNAVKRSDLCPPTDSLGCLNVLFLYKCESDNDCASSSNGNMVCCPTNCPDYSKQMCVSRAIDYCPFQTPYHLDAGQKCHHKKDCDKDMLCCKDISGQGYCRKA